MPQQAHPEARYRAIRNPDGSKTIKDVPVLVAHAVPLITADGKPMLDKKGRRLHYPVGKKWLVDALGKAYQQRQQDGYIPPLHINHHNVGRTVAPAGLMKLTRVARGMYKGKAHWMLYADLIIDRPKVYAEMAKGRLRFLSAEVHNFGKPPEVNSAAIMSDTAPFFQLAPVIPSEDEDQTPWRMLPKHAPNPGHYEAGRPNGGLAQLIDIGAAARLQADDCVGNKISKLRHEGKPQDQSIAIAHRMCGKPKAKNYSDGDSGMMDQKMVEKLTGAIMGAIMGALGGGESEHKDDAEADAEAGADYIYDDIDETDEIVAEDALSVPDRDEAPRPVEIEEEDEDDAAAAMQATTEPAATAKAAGLHLGKIAGENKSLRKRLALLERGHAKLQGHIAANEKATKVQAAIADAYKRVKPYGFTLETVQEVARGGGAKLSGFVEGVTLSGAPDLSDYDGELPLNLTTEEDAEMAFVNKLPAECQSMARQYAADYRAGQAQGMAFGETLPQFVVRGMIGMDQLDARFESVAAAAPTNSAAPNLGR